MSELIWWPHKGYGYQAGSFTYGARYWEEFRAKDATNIGRVLTKMRAEFVRTFLDEGPLDLVDVGIGGGLFVAEMGCEGMDVNENANDWLRERGALWDGAGMRQAMTFWDSLEHIEDPDPYLSRTQWAFISTPIYQGAEYVPLSKHYKPGEHLWYFSHSGLKKFMAGRGFLFRDSNMQETSVGRVDIGTYAFERV